MSQPGLVVPVSGPYSSVWNTLPLGVGDDNGYEIAVTIAGEAIEATDAFAKTLVEGIYQGQNWRLRFRGLEWKAGLMAILQMFGGLTVQSSSPGVLTPSLGAIGDRWTKYCQSLVLTSLLGAYPPATPTSLTALSAGLSPNSQSTFNMTSAMRQLPLEMVLLPYSATVGSSTFNVPFTTVG